MGEKEVGDMAQWLSTSVVLPEDLCSVPRTPKELTTSEYHDLTPRAHHSRENQFPQVVL